MLAAAGATGGLIVLVLGFGLQAAGVLPAPGSSAATQNSAQIGDLATTLSGLDQRVTSIEAASAQAVADRALLDDLSGQVGVVDAFATSLSDRLLSAEASIASLSEGTGTQAAGGQGLAALEERIARLEIARPAESGVGVSDSGLATLRNEVDVLASRVSSIEARLDGLATASAPSAERNDTARALAVVSLRRAAEDGGAFAEELAVVDALGVDADTLKALTPLAQKGAPSRAGLVAEFPAVADAILATEQGPQTGNGVIDRLLAYGGGLVKIRPTEPLAGDDTGAIVSRMRAAVEAGDLAKALAERETLSPAARAVSQTWAAVVVDRLSIDRAIDEIGDSAGIAGKSG
jgi:hypothetical protein